MSKLSNSRRLLRAANPLKHTKDDCLLNYVRTFRQLLLRSVATSFSAYFGDYVCHGKGRRTGLRKDSGCTTTEPIRRPTEAN